MKEEFVNDAAPLPLFNGRIVCWLEMAQGSTVGSGTGAPTAGGTAGSSSNNNNGLPVDSEVESSVSSALPPPGIERGPGVGETRPPSFQ